MSATHFSGRVALLVIAVVAISCQPADRSTTPEGLSVLAAESFLADIVRNVAGDRLTVGVLIPAGVDPHSFEPTPADLRKAADCDLLIVNGAGLEGSLEELMRNAGDHARIVNASAGLASRTPGPSEANATGHGTDISPEGDRGGEDPHFWLDPNLVVRYVQNIRDALSAADPTGADIYRANAEQYIARLLDLDAWIRAEVQQLSPERRKLVTNHESLGYFADRYGFYIVGAIIPSVSTGATPSAQELAGLVEQIRKAGAPAIFVEMGANPKLAQLVAQETGVRVVDRLMTHSVTSPDGEATDYISMMQTNVRGIVDALK